jgi:hypothetical protein
MSRLVVATSPHLVLDLHRGRLQVLLTWQAIPVSLLQMSLGSGHRQVLSPQVLARSASCYWVPFALCRHLLRLHKDLVGLRQTVPVLSLLLLPVEKLREQRPRQRLVLAPQASQSLQPSNPLLLQVPSVLLKPELSDLFSAGFWQL